MNIFVDTSAFYAVLDHDDANHKKAASIWRNIFERDHRLTTSNYVLLETVALLQSRIGLEAVMAFHNDIIPIVQVVFVTPELHSMGVSALLAASRRKLSLVDCVSFEICRKMGADAVFAFDSHFKMQGFTMI